MPDALWNLSERFCAYPLHLTPEQWRDTLRYVAANWPRTEALRYFGDIYEDLWD